ncbi:MAG TPA: M20 family metallopeptidase [Spirochaetota bacterium]|nr:MAG: putative hydrolase YxeP [Spirochaetes bacterium ADurb.Bin133]HNZ27797.1 M20 family metallopeptidase [Spirochaetota bacterium]HPY87990.1 M20 family metallopeptidase [Spirochaetota bacterium]
MSYFERAKKLFDEAREVRRQIHQNPEVGFELPETMELIKEKLEKYDIAYSRLGDTYALVGTLGDPGKGKTLLLRADMDAIPMAEGSDLEFASKKECSHLCGHDLHAVSLLVALIMLKEDEDKLRGQIKFLFQPAEETLNGGKLMLEKGVLENPKPDAGMALHMWPNGEKPGILIQKEEALASALNFKIEIRGKGAHGALPYNGIDPVFVASQIINGANGILARELPSNKGASLSMGYINAPGGAINIIPPNVYLEGTSRSLYTESAEHIGQRLPEIVEHIGKAFRAETKYEAVANVPALINTLEMSELVKESAEEVLGAEYAVEYIGPFLASEDYAHIASRLPESCYFFVSCPLPDETGQVYAVHHPKVVFNEEALIYGPATMAQAAVNWLKNHCR